MSARRLGEKLKARARKRRHRQLVVLRGSAVWSEQTARELVSDDSVIALTCREPTPDGWISPQAARNILGNEIASAVIDTHAGIDADAVGIISGAVRAGGLVCFLQPDKIEQTRLPTPYRTRFRRLLAQQRDAVQIVEGAALPDCTIDSPRDVVSDTAVMADLSAPATVDQEKAVASVVGVVEGQRRRPALLLADRGRGKSAALGIAAGRLLRINPEPIVVTGASRATTVFRHAHAVCAEHASLLLWKDVETLLTETVPCQLLLIDEAAMLPLHTLERLLASYPRIAMASTVHGYEGSGRGFLTRFDTILNTHTRGYHKVPLTLPVRWALHDPVEQAVNRLLVLDAALPELPEPVINELQPVVTRVDRAHLAGSETLLRDLFSLLVLAHYKTRPNDLQTMLETPRLRVYRLSNGNSDDALSLGVALVAEEGGLAQSLGADIARGKRRPPGQVLPELLALHGQANAVQRTMWRIMRIVIHPEARRRGLGSQLIEHIVADSDRAALVGSNFALSSSLLVFWQRCGFDLVQISRRRTVQSGRHSGTVLRGGDELASTLTEEMAASLAANLPLMLATSLRDLESTIVHQVVKGLAKGLQPPSAETLGEVSDVALGGRDPQNVPASLSAAALHGLANGAFPEPELVIQRVLQQRPWSECDGVSGAAGWREGNRIIRAAFSDYLAWVIRPDHAAR